MKIAIIGSRHVLSGYSGIERGLAQMLPHLAELGHKITVFGGPPVGSRQAGRERWNGIDMVHIPGLAGKHTESISRSASAVFKTLKEGFDIVHYQHLGPSVFAPVNRIAGQATVVTVAGLDWQRAKWNRAASKAIHTAERIAVRSANAIVVLSRDLQTYFDETYDRETFRIPNGINPKPAPTCSAQLAQFNLKAGQYVLFAARLVPEKACHDLIRAWNAIQTDKKLVIAGSPGYALDYGESLKALARKDNVVFTGHVSGDALDQLFAHARLFVLPSYLEGLSLSLLEAIGYGRAVLVSNIPENLEAVGECGVVFKVGDVTDLRHQLERLIDDDGAIADLQRMTRAKIDAMPSWEDVARRHDELYLSLLPSSSSLGLNRRPKVIRRRLKESE